MPACSILEVVCEKEIDGGSTDGTAKTACNLVGQGRGLNF